MNEKTKDVLVVISLIIAFFSLGVFSSSYFFKASIPKSEITNTYTIVISDSVLNEINELYFDSAVEFCACLDGKIQKDEQGFSSVFYVDKLREVTYGTDKGVTCSKTCSFAQIHSHPKNCKFSPSDVINFQEIQKNQGTLLYFLICPPNQISFMMWNDYREVRYG